jgi:hypothetical protein
MNHAKLLAGAALLALSACGGGKGDDALAENVQQGFENSADQLDAAAENASGAQEERLEDEAEVMRETGEAAADAIDETDINAQTQVSTPATPNAQ